MQIILIITNEPDDWDKSSDSFVMLYRFQLSFVKFMTGSIRVGMLALLVRAATMERRKGNRIETVFSCRI